MDDNDSPDQQDFTDRSPNQPHDPELAGLCDTLQTHGITRVLVHYEGCGDSGCIETIEYMPEGISLPDGFEDKLRDVAENYFPTGYENNDGGYGTLTLYPGDGLAKLEHCDRYEDSITMDAEPAQLPDEIHTQLAQLGVTDVIARFDGSGDSGQIDEILVHPEGITLDEKLTNELEEFLLDQLLCGWENNAGGFGEFTVDVPGNLVEVNGYLREEESNSEETCWKWREQWPTLTIMP